MCYEHFERTVLVRVDDGSCYHGNENFEYKNMIIIYNI